MSDIPEGRGPLSGPDMDLLPGGSWRCPKCGEESYRYGKTKDCPYCQGEPGVPTPSRPYLRVVKP